MAVVAASIGGLVAWNQLAHTKRQQREDRWWETLSWVFDRSVSTTAESEILPVSVALPMLQALVDSAADDGPSGLRKRAVGSILTMFTLPSEASVDDEQDDLRNAATSRAEAEGEAPSPSAGERPGRVVVDEADIDMLNQLRSSVSDSSPAVAAAVYEARVYEALIQIAENHEGWRVSRQPVVPVGRPDFVLRTSNGPIVVETKYARRAITAATAAGWVGHLRKYVSGAGPTARGLLVCNQPLTKAGKEYWSSEVPDGLHSVLWTGDTDELAERIATLISGG